MELYLQIKDSLNFHRDFQDGSMTLLEQVLGYAPPEVVWVFVNDLIVHFSMTAVQVNLLSHVRDNYSILSKEKCEIIRRFLYLEVLDSDNFASMLNDFENIKIEAYEFIFGILDCTLYREALLNLRGDLIIHPTNLKAKAIVESINSKL